MRSDVPERYQDRTLDTFEQVSESASAALLGAWQVVDGQARTLVLVGRPGVGKSHLAAGVVHGWNRRTAVEYRAAKEAAAERGELLPPFRPAEWCNVAQLVADLRSEFGTDSRATQGRVERLRTWPSLVVLDDLGRERISDWTGELIYTLVNARYEARLTTVATSNLQPAELVDNGYWPAISRLAEDGALVEIKAPDRRLGPAR